MLIEVRNTGKRHLRENRSCQDRYMINDTNETLILAVADGHGGSPYVRSGLGARIACRTALKILADKTISVNEYPTRIKQKFDSFVRKHLKLHPLSDYEKGRLGNNPDIYAYGTTLIVAKLTKNSTYLLHIGDGEIHAINNNGKFFPELPIDPNCQYGNTSSLVTADAVKKIRFKQYYEPAACVIMHTDGYTPRNGNSWNIYENLGLSYSKNDLKQELECSDLYGDDQTIVLYFNGTVVEESEFRHGIECEKRKAIEKANLNELYSKQSELESFLQAAMTKYNSLSGKERELFKKRSIEPRYNEYKDITEKLKRLIKTN